MNTHLLHQKTMQDKINSIKMLYKTLPYKQRMEVRQRINGMYDFQVKDTSEEDPKIKIKRRHRSTNIRPDLLDESEVTFQEKLKKFLETVPKEEIHLATAGFLASYLGSGRAVKGTIGPRGALGTPGVEGV